MREGTQARWGRELGLGFAAAVALVASGAAAEVPEHLRRIDALFQQLEYEAALEEIRLARLASHDAGEATWLELYEGVVLAGMNHLADAERCFRAALLANPAAALPVLVSPKTVEAFERIRADILRETAARAATPQQVPEPPLRTGTRSSEAAAAAADGPRFHPWRKHAWIPASAAGALAAAGTFSYLRLLDARSDIRAASPEADINRRIDEGRRYERLAGIAFAAGAAALFAAGGLFFWSVHNPEAAAFSGVSLGAPTGQGFGATWAVSFH